VSVKHKIDNLLNEAINDAIDGQIRDVLYNLNNALGGLLWTVKMEAEKKGGVGDLETLLRQIVLTTHRIGPEGEDWPAWKADEKHVVEIRERLVGILQSHGIEQSWNYGGESKKVKGDVLTITGVAERKGGNCNFCTRPNESGMVNEIRSRDENRRMVVVLCDKCLEELRK
jgi:hypothetical protein